MLSKAAQLCAHASAMMLKGLASDNIRPLVTDWQQELLTLPSPTITGPPLRIRTKSGIVQSLRLGDHADDAGRWLSPLGSTHHAGFASVPL